MPFFLITSQAVTPQRPFDRKPVEFEPDNGKSYLGTPVYSYIEFPEGKYETLSGEIISFDGCKLTAVLLEVSISKNIVITEIQGKDVSVKEYVGLKDFQIQVSGRIVNETNAIPEIALTALKNICLIPDSVVVNCPFLQYFDINYVIVQDARFNEIEGSRNMIDFSISLISDVPPSGIQSGEFITVVSPPA